MCTENRFNSLRQPLVKVAVIFLVAICMVSCRTTKPTYVEIIKTDTLRVYHTDTLRLVHNDTIREYITKTIHDSIIRQTIVTNIIDQNGNVVHSEKETTTDNYHNADTQSQFIQHTVDSLLHSKLDSIYQANHDDSTVILEKETPWYKKLWSKTQGLLATLGIISLVFLILWIIRKTAGSNWLKKLLP